MLWTIIRKASNHCQDVDKRGDEDHGETTVGLETTVRIENTVRMGMSIQIDDQDQSSVLKYNLIIS